MPVRDPDPIIHQPTRLRIMVLLAGLGEADFNFLLNTLELTRGNLSAQSSKLEEAGYLDITKSFEGKIPRTTYRLTEHGRHRLAEYWKTLDELRSSAQGG